MTNFVITAEVPEAKKGENHCFIGLEAWPLCIVKFDVIMKWEDCYFVN